MECLSVTYRNSLDFPTKTILVRHLNELSAAPLQNTSKSQDTPITIFTKQKLYKRNRHNVLPVSQGAGFLFAMGIFYAYKK